MYIHLFYKCTAILYRKTNVPLYTTIDNVNTVLIAEKEYN
jgi:hypothetical protein